MSNVFFCALAICSNICDGLHHSAKMAWPQVGDKDYQLTPEQVQAMEVLKAKNTSLKIFNQTLSAIATMPTSYVIQQHGYDILFKALKDYNDTSIKMQAYRGLSDQGGTKEGAERIANYGGLGKGIDLMVQDMIDHPAPYEALCADHLSFKYEILAVLWGLLNNDPTGHNLKHAIKAGLVDQIIHTMTVEGDLRASVATSCRVARSMIQGNRSIAEQLKKKGVCKLMKNAKETYKGKNDTTPFYFGTTMRQFFRLRSCKFVWNQSCVGN